MTKKIPPNSILCVAPLSGKSTASRKFSNVLDVESSRYMFVDNLIESKYSGNEELAKGDPERVLLPDAHDVYLQVVLDACEQPVDYVTCGPFLISQLAELKRDGKLSRDLYLVQPMPRPGLVADLEEVAIARGNRVEWREKFLPSIEGWLEVNKLSVDEDHLIELEKGQWLSDVLERKISR